MIHFLVPGQDAYMIQDYKDGLGQWGEENVTAISYQEAVRKTEFPSGRYVFTGLDRLGPHSTTLLGDLYEKLQAGFHVPPLNHPAKSLRRYELLKALSEAGLNQFRAFGAWEDLSDLRYPVFVRHRSKDGGVPDLLSSRAEIEREIGKFLMAGSHIEDILVVEFFDTSDSSGLYRKYAAYLIGGHVVPLAMSFGSLWVLRGHSDEPTPASTAEEKEYVLGNPHEEEIASIFRIANIDFGRIDYSLHGGRVQTWEINTLPMQRRSPGAEPPPEEIEALRECRRSLNRERLGFAWKGVESKAGEGEPVKVDFEPEVWAGAQEEWAQPFPPTYPQGEPFSLVRSLLRHIKPILKPLAVRILYPLLSRKARAQKK